MKLTVTYEGPIKGKIRVLMNRKKIKNLYADMLEEVGTSYPNEVESLQEAVNQINEEWKNNDFGMYLFIEDNIIKFGFVDCEMKDEGCYELVF